MGISMNKIHLRIWCTQIDELEYALDTIHNGARWVYKLKLKMCFWKQFACNSDRHFWKLSYRCELRKVFRSFLHMRIFSWCISRSVCRALWHASHSLCRHRDCNMGHCTHIITCVSEEFWKIMLSSYFHLHLILLRNYICLLSHYSIDLRNIHIPSLKTYSKWINILFI